MVNPEEFKKKVESLIFQDYKIEFLGKNFNTAVNSLSDIKAEKIYQWIKEVIEEQVQPILVGSKKPYKEWRVKQLLVFRYPLSIEGTAYRILFVKVKNSMYIEFHLGDHKYYNKITKELQLKKSTRYL